MKKNSTLLILAFLIQAFVFAAAPTVTGSNLSFSSIDGTSFSGSFTSGNGTNRIVVMKKGSPVTGLPVNGIEYTPNSVFGSAGSAFTQPGEFVISRSSWNSISVSGLEPGVVYHVAVFEYNGTGINTQYLMLPLAGSQSTAVPPTNPTTALTLTAKTGNNITLGWTKGNGSGRIILARKGAPVNMIPADLTMYFTGDGVFESGTKIGADNYVVYKGNGTSATIKNLEPNTEYHFASFEYNGGNTPVHLIPGTTFNTTTNAGPSVAASAPSFIYVEGSSFTFAVNYGNGSKRLIIAKKDAPVTAVPQNGLAYTASAVFGTPASQIAPGEFVVATTTVNSVAITNLEPNTVYHFRVYEYDEDKMGNTYYLTSTYLVKSGSTSITPATVATNLHLTSLTGSSATIAFTAGSGNYRTVLMKAGSAVDASPQELVKYTYNTSFGTGTQIGTGNFVVMWGMNGSSMSITNLQPGITYHISVYEFNGYDKPVYSAGGATFSFTVPLEPTAISTSAWSTFIEGKSFRQIWTNGNGSRRLVIAKKGSAVSFKPADQQTYQADENFGQGSQPATGEFVVYDGTQNYVNIKNLELGTVYHFAVFEYNVGPDGKPDYLTTSWLAASTSTAARPTIQTTIGTISTSSAGATINFTKGNGEYRIFIVRKDAAVNAEPQDYTKYNYSSSFGSAGSHMGDGNYVVTLSSGTGNFSITNLQPNSTYHITAYELNGSAEPAYLKTTPPTSSFTTTDVPGATVPTIASTLPVVNAVDGNKFTFKWTNGNGEKRIVVMRKGSAVSFVPASAVSYTANSVFGTGTDLGDGQYVVYNGNGSTVEITGLLPSGTYHLAVYEFNGTATLVRYLNTPLTATGNTSSAPSTAPGSPAASTASGQLTLTWTNGNGSGRIVVVKESSAVTGIPSDVAVYPANAFFKSGSQIAAGEYVVYAGASNTVTITGLTNGQTYHYRIFEYNGSLAPVYNTSTSVAGSAIISSALPVRLLHFDVKKQDRNVVLKWATSEEVNSASFVIERSFDGVQFTGIKSIQAAGNSNTTVQYSYTDAGLPDSKVYYRLKQVDADERKFYSAVLVVDMKESVSVRVYPNPAATQIRIDLPKGAAVALVTVHDAQGTRVARQSYLPGQTINISGWSKGVYQVTILAGGNEYSRTIIKQ